MKRPVILALLASLMSVTSAQAAPATERVWIEAAPNRLPAVEKLLKGKGIESHFRFDELNALVVTAPQAVLDELRRDPRVLAIEPDVKRYPMAQEVPYGIDMVQARDVWDADRDGVIDTGAATGAGALVCIIDSGIAITHEDLPGANVIGGMPDGYDTDTCGHGTHVAGTISAVNNDLGVVGVSPGEVDLYIVKVFDGADCAYSYSSRLANAALNCAKVGADVINMSLGGGFPSRLEERAFDRVASMGTLSVASAGNDGTTGYSYPASYPSVVSVAAVDSTTAVADFSQKNDEVDLAAPGVDVLSTVPFGTTAGFTVAGTDYAAIGMENAAYGSATGTLVDGGLCTSAGAWTGMVVLCQRGDISFADKVAAVEAGGGVGAAIYNNEPGNFSGTLGDNPSDIPAVSLSQEDGQAIVASALGQTATVSLEYVENTYAYYSGTSMSAPHVSGAAAVLFSSNPSLTPAQVREALTATALDLGEAGRDDAYGYGLIQLYDAWQYLGAGPSALRPPLQPARSRVLSR